MMINTVCGTGSTGRICSQIAESLVKQEHIVKIGYGRHHDQIPDSYLPYALQIGNTASVIYHAWMTRWTDHHGFYSKKATKQFLRYVDAFGPDIIHLHNLHGYYIHIGLLFEYLKAHPIPVVWTLHDCWAFTGHCAAYTFAQCSRWQSQCYDCPQKKRYPQSWFKDNSKQNWLEKRSLFTSLDHMILVTPSQWLSNEIKQSFLNVYPVEVIRNGIDLNIFRKPNDPIMRKSKKKIALSVASQWNKYKGLDDLVDISKKLENDWELVVIGLTKRQKNMFPPQVICIEKIREPNELANWYAMADVYINTSYEEAMGMTTVEALASGTPVICYRSTAIPEFVDSMCGIVIDPGDTDALVKNLNHAACLKFNFNVDNIAHPYSHEVMCRSYLELYEEMLK